MALNLTALKAELQNDPTSRGYAAPLTAGLDNAVADLLNAVRQGAQIGRTLVHAHEFVNAIVPSEYVALSQAQRDYLVLVASAGEVQLAGGGVRTALGTLFGAGTATRTAFAALQDRPATRAEELFGDGVFITADHIAATRRLP